MKAKATFLLSIGLLLVSLPAFAGPPAHAGVTRTQIEGVDNWGWQGPPLATPTITCPGGELMVDSFGIPYCSDSNTGRLHARNGAAWSCMTSDDPRMTGVGLYTSNWNFDADSSGSVWGTWKLVPTEDCDKDAVYTEEYEDFVENATSFWRGTWNGQRQAYSVNGFNIWIGELKIIGRGVGGDLDGLQFKGTEWVETYTPVPVPYEFLPPVMGLFDEPEADFIGTIKE